MKIELEYKGGGKAFIETDVEDDPDSRVKVTISSAVQYASLTKRSKGIEYDLKEEFEQFYGHYGHMQSLEETTNLDLQCAVCLLKPDSQFKLISITPRIKPNPNFPPKGAVS